MMSSVIAAFLRFRRLERGHAVRDRLDPRQRRAAVRERAEHEEEREGPVSGGTNAAAADSIGTTWPVITLNTPTTSRTPMLPRKK